MREYLLLLLIAIIGLAGLVSIHQEVKLQTQHQPLLSRQLEVHLAPKSQSAATDTSQRLKIFQGDSWSQIRFDIENFHEDESLLLDFGNGVRETLTKAHTEVIYDKPGVYFIKLFCNNYLLEANEIELQAPQITL